MSTIGIGSQQIAVAFMAQPPYLEALSRMMTKYGYRSKASMVMAALEALAREHGETLPPRLKQRYSPE